MDVNRGQESSTSQMEFTNDKANRIPLDMRSHNIYSKARLHMDM